MSKRTQRKRCRDCKHVTLADVGRMQWCDRCGGELIPIRYGQKAVKRGGR